MIGSYLSFDPSDWHIVKCKMETCIAEIRAWLKWNCLKLIDGKTEMMIVGRNSLIGKIDGVRELCIGDTVLESSQTVRNIGAKFDSEMRMLRQVYGVCKSYYGSLYCVRQI